MLAKKVFKNVLYNSSSILIANLSGIVITVYIARILKPELFGIYSLALSITFLALIFTDLGINSTLVRYVAYAHSIRDYDLVRGYIKGLSKLKFILTLITSISMFTASNIISTYVFHKPNLTIPLKIMSIYILFYATSSFLTSMFNAFNNFKANLVKSIVYESSRLLSIILLVSMGFSVIGALFGFVIASFLSLIVLLILLINKYNKYLIGKAKQMEWRRVIRFTSYLTIGSITWVVFAYVDAIMIGMFLASEYVGYYKAAYNIVGAISGLISIPTVLFPVFVQLEGKDLKSAFNRAFKYASILAFPIIFGLIAIGRELVSLVYGMAYLKAVPVLTILSFLILRSSLGFWSVIFNAKERPEFPVYVTFIAMILNVVLNYFLILKWGIIGASTATLISNAFSWIVLAVLSKRLFGVFFKTEYLIKPIIASIVMFLFISSLKFSSLIDGIVYVSISTFLYFAILFLLKGADIEDIKYIINIIQSK